ncbi:unnamed protein product [Lactuca virosa]|uniref:Uncharacterized protein n=1 Tax=Lactuca virosa TaxID=75947 RepID=A0AAU9MBK7_9ASTR|nr:unnamed protein product [Lactuca virosa]
MTSWKEWMGDTYYERDDIHPMETNEIDENNSFNETTHSTSSFPSTDLCVFLPSTSAPLPFPTSGRPQSTVVGVANPLLRSR